METIKLTLSKWVVKELRYYEAHHQINLNDFISNSVSEYLKNTDISVEDIITSDNTKTVMTVEVSKDIAEQLQTTANEISVDCSDIVFTALAFTMPNLISVIEIEEEIQKRGKYE